MKKEHIIRAWKDPEFRKHLSAEARAALPESPAGRSMSELEDAALGLVAGGGSCLPVTLGKECLA